MRPWKIISSSCRPSSCTFSSGRPAWVTIESLVAVLLEQDRIVRCDQPVEGLETSVAHGFSRISRLITSRSSST